MLTGSGDVKMSLFRHGGVCLQPKCPGNLQQKYYNMEVSLGNMIENLFRYIYLAMFSVVVLS